MTTHPAPRSRHLVLLFFGVHRETKGLRAAATACGLVISAYAADAEAHDAITRVRRRFCRTIQGLQRLIATGVPVRAGTIEMDGNAGRASQTREVLAALGVVDVGLDRLRQLGRGRTDGADCLDHLCQTCAGNTLCVGPDGRVSPCNLSRAWSVGSVLATSLARLAPSAVLQAVRSTIHERVVRPRLLAAAEAGGVTRGLFEAALRGKDFVEAHARPDLT